MKRTLQDVYQRLSAALGPQGWWPGQSPFEVMVGAVLVQNTAWKNVERAIGNLSAARVLSPKRIHRLPQDELEQLVRPAGYYRLKAARLRNLVDFLFRHYKGSLARMFSTDLPALREQLLAVKGIGPETADSILLYAGNLPSFVVDTYTHRVLARHGWIDFDANYHQIQEYFVRHLEPDVALYNEYHALMVRVGHLYCRKRPRCDSCPLRELLPKGGWRQPV